MILQLLAPDRTRVIKGRRSPVQGWYSTSLNKWKRAPTVEAVQTGRTIRYVTLLVPVPRPDSLVRLSAVTIDGPRIRFQLEVDARREQVIIDRAEVTVRTLRNLGPSRERTGVGR